MILKRDDGGLVLTIRPPLIYLDHCAVGTIAETPDLKQAFLEIFQDRGTVMLSILNLLEISQCQGACLEAIYGLLDDIGPNWLLSDNDPQTITDRMLRRQMAPACFLAPDELIAMLYKAMPPGPISLGVALRHYMDDNLRRLAFRCLHPAHLRVALQDARRRYEARAEALPNPHPRGTPLWVQVELLRGLASHTKPIQDNDLIDIMHASVGLAHATVVVLDKHWAHVASILRVHDTAVFKVGHLRQALETIRTLDISQFRMFPPGTLAPDPRTPPP